MKRIQSAMLTALLLGLSGLTASAQLVTYTPGSAGVGMTTIAATSTATNFSSSSLSGTGSLFTVGGTGSAFRGTAFSLSTLSLSTGTGYTFTITPTVSGTINFSSASLSFNGFLSIGSSMKFDLYTNIGGGGIALVGSTASVGSTQGSHSFNLSSLGSGGNVNVVGNTPYTFHIDGYTSGVSGLAFDLNSTISLGGSFTPVPEPATMTIFIAIGLVGVARFRRRSC